MSVHSSIPSLAFDSSCDVLDYNWPRPFSGPFVGDLERNQPSVVESAWGAVDGVVEQLFHMTLASLRGYQDLARASNELPLRTFAEVLIRQRSAQCVALVRLCPQLLPQWLNLDLSEESFADPSAVELRVAWLRAIWNYEREEFGRFGDYIELAEATLEDACLAASETLHNLNLSDLLTQHALNICGASQRLEELTGELVHTECLRD